MNPYMIAYIISCLPSNSMREKRLKFHNQQIDEWIKHTDIPIVILAMGYQPHEYHSDLGGRIRYIRLDQPVPPAEARNICLKDFYSSGYRWAVLMDNDATLYNSPSHNSGYNFIAEMTAQIDSYDKIGLFYPVNPMQTPFNKRWQRDTSYARNHIFERGFSTKGTLLFVRNFPQFGQAPIYFDPAFSLMDDNAFGLDVLAAGQPVFQNWNMVLKELVEAGPLSAFGGTEDRRPLIVKENAQMVIKHQGLGLRQKKTGSLNRIVMVNKCWPRSVPQLLVIKKPGLALPVLGQTA